jgi:hypothetical protein
MRVEYALVHSSKHRYDNFPFDKVSQYPEQYKITADSFQRLISKIKSVYNIEESVKFIKVPDDDNTIIKFYTSWNPGWVFVHTFVIVKRVITSVPIEEFTD